MAEVQIPLHQKAMSNRYPPKNILEIRGYSGTSSKSLKFMDKTQTNFKVYPPSLLHINPENETITMDTLADLLDLPENENEYVISNRHHNNSWNEDSNEGWTSTGVLSDRSSVYSIDDGDFDKEASKKVNNQLKEIESILYEQNPSYRPILVECKEWLEKFPHLRVLGNQISNVPKEEGFYHIETKFTNPVLQKQQSINNNNSNSNENTNTNSRYTRRRELSDLSSNQGLLVNGSNLHVKQIELTEKNPELKFLEEEIFEQEGNYEELLAYDNREDEYLLEHNKRLNINKRRRRNLPPVTPKAAMKDMVLNLLFDHAWSEIINWSSDTIKRYAKSITSGTTNYLSLDEPTNIDHSTPVMSDPRNDDTLTNSNDNNNKETTTITTPTTPIQQQQQQQQQLVNKVKTNLIENNNNNKYSPKINNNHQIIISNNNNNNSSPNVPSFMSNMLPLNIQQQQQQPSSLAFPRKQNIQFNSFYNNENNETIQPLPPSRDSTFYIQQNINNNNNSLKNSNMRNHSSLTNENILTSLDRNTLDAAIDHHPTNGFDNFLKIKQLKSGNSINNKPNLTASGSRLGSGNKKQYPMSMKKRYQNDIKSSLDTIYDKNIVVHGAAVAKPAHNSSNNNHNHHHHDHNRNNAIHVDEERSAANDYDDDDDYVSVSVGIPHNHNYADNDNFDENNSMANAMITNTRHDYKKLPPIELTGKPARISSANNSRQNREKNDRPMTTTSTRNEPHSTTNHKRVGTPLMQVNNTLNTNRSTGLNSLLSTNIQITGIRFSNDETSSNTTTTTTTINPLHSNYNKILGLSSQSSRKNSIRDNFQYNRIHNK